MGYEIGVNRCENYANWQIKIQHNRPEPHFSKPNKKSPPLIRHLDHLLTIITALNRALLKLPSLINLLNFPDLSPLMLLHPYLIRLFNHLP